MEFKNFRHWNSVTALFGFSFLVGGKRSSDLSPGGVEERSMPHT